MKEKLDLYLKEHLELQYASFKKAKFASNERCMSIDAFYDEEKCLSNIDDYIDSNKNENKFQKLLFSHIDRKNLKDSDVYNKVNIDRRLFSKIRSDVNYHPSKETVILLGIALELNEDEMEDLLLSASYSLPMNNEFDLIIRFCFKEKIYDLFTINDYLDSYNCKLLV